MLRVLSALVRHWISVFIPKVSPVQFKPSNRWADWAMVAGVNDGRGSRITLLDRGSRDQQVHVSSPSIWASERDDGGVGGCALQQSLRPMPIIPIVLQEWKPEHGVPLDTPNEQPGQNVPSLNSDTRRLKEWNVGWDENQDAVVGRLSAAAPELIFDDGQPGEGAQHTVQSRRSCGRCRCRDNILSTNIYQARREPQRTRCFWVPQFSSMLQKMDSNLSKLSWRPFMLITKSTHDPPLEVPP